MSEVKVNKISPRSGTEVTLGDSGDTFTIPSGATINNQGTATNFGATGSASWNTTVKTSTFTAVAGEGYFVNTTGGVVTVNLPAGVAGAVVAIKDYAGTFSTNNCTIDANGSDKIGGFTNDVILSTDGIAITLIFIDSTQGWLVTDDGLQSSADNNPFLKATGGTITTSGDDKIHTFTSPGTFAVCKIADCAASNEVSYVVVAGGGGGGGVVDHGGGGGAGGYRETKSPVTPYTASPLDGQPNAPNRVTVTATSFPITVGAGGAREVSGSNSIFSTITSAGGGRGGQPPQGAEAGGSGGGSTYSASGGAGNTPPTSPSQGFPGGTSCTSGPNYGTGGGGGALVAGAAGSPTAGGPGGNGTTSSITGASVARAGGGGGSSYSGGAGGTGGTGGGGAGTTGGSSNAVAGTANTGGGGGGGERSVPVAGGFAGGSGIVIIRYKFK